MTKWEDVEEVSVEEVRSSSKIGKRIHNFKGKQIQYADSVEASPRAKKLVIFGVGLFMMFIVVAFFLPPLLFILDVFLAIVTMFFTLLLAFKWSKEDEHKDVEI